jgi:hypothetical protein
VASPGKLPAWLKRDQDWTGGFILQQLNDFIRGQEDRKKDIPHKEGESREYDAGYGEQYSKEQVDDKRTDR